MEDGAPVKAPLPPTRSHAPTFRAALLGPRYWLTWLLYLLCGCLALVPLRLRSRLAAALAPLAWRLPSRRRDVARVNLALCFADRSEPDRQRLLERHAQLFCNVFLDYGRLLFGASRSLDEVTDVHGLEHLEAASLSGRGVIVLTPHVLTLEHAGQWLARRRPLVGIVRRHEGNDLLDWMVTRMRTRGGGRVIPHVSSMLTLIRAIRAGQWLYYLPDDDARAGNSVFAPFYGVPKATVPTLGRLASACEAPVLPLVSGYSLRRRRFWVRFLPPIEWGPPGEPVEEATRINRILETLVDTDPAQYMWSAKIFRGRVGSANPYRSDGS